MKKKLFNIHKLIGVNILLFFFISLFFGILTIFQPYINLWEDPKKHITNIAHENIDLNQCIKQVNKRTYYGEDGKKLRKDFIKVVLPAVEVKSTNLMIVKNRANFHLDPNTCKRVRSKTFTISYFMDKIHTGAIFNSLYFKIIFGFMSVAVVFLCLSGMVLIIKNSYKNAKTKTVKGFFAKYHRLLSLYTLPLILMFGLTGALFNLGVYSSPLVTNYLTKGETANILKVEKNILVDKDLELLPRTQDVKTMDLNILYKKAVSHFEDIRFYEMQIYNFNDINAKVKFIGYEPRNFFISSMTNETNIVLNGVTGELISKKMASEGSLAEKTLDSIFYLHYLRTFSDIPRIIFGIICIAILFGLVYSMFLWLFRAKKDKFTYKVLKPLSFTILLGSLVSSAVLFLSSWIIPKKYFHFYLFEKFYNTQEILFYLVFVFMFIYILIKKELFIITKNTFFLTGILLILSALAHQIFSGFNFMTLLQKELYIQFYMDIALILFGLFFIALYFKLPKKYFEFNPK